MSANSLIRGISQARYSLDSIMSVVASMRPIETMAPHSKKLAPECAEKVDAFAKECFEKCHGEIYLYVVTEWIKETVDTMNWKACCQTFFNDDSTQKMALTILTYPSINDEQNYVFFKNHWAIEDTV